MITMYFRLRSQFHVFPVFIWSGFVCPHQRPGHTKYYVWIVALQWTQMGQSVISCLRRKWNGWRERNKSGKSWLKLGALDKIRIRRPLNKYIFIDFKIDYLGIYLTRSEFGKIIFSCCGAGQSSTSIFSYFRSMVSNSFWFFFLYFFFDPSNKPMFRSIRGHFVLPTQKHPFEHEHLQSEIKAIK